MLIKTETAHEISPASLAKTLADAEPSEFAAFWFAFGESCPPAKLDAFAKTMAPNLGAARKLPLKELCRLMEFHSETGKRVKG